MNMLRIVFFTLTLFVTMSAEAFDWETLQPGIEYLEFTPLDARMWSHIHIFRVDPKLYTLKLALASDTKLPSTTVKTLAERHNALLAINGGFFDPNYTPLGLRIQNGVVRHPIKQTSWWGIFYLRDNLPYVSSQILFKPNTAMPIAVQGGPRLVVNGRIPHLKPGLDERTALGITRDGKIIILATQNYPYSTGDLASFMRDVLQCKEALNLDGGGSTQVYAKISGFHLYVSGYSNIADAIMVVAR